jgi:hypothetical protein
VFIIMAYFRSGFNCENRYWLLGILILPVSCFVSRRSGLSCFLTALWKSGRFLNTGTVAMGRATGRVTLSILDVAESVNQMSFVPTNRSRSGLTRNLFSSLSKINSLHFRILLKKNS